jgi:hypothetical protein
MVSYQRAGDYASPHTDVKSYPASDVMRAKKSGNTAEQAEFRRGVAFVLHMTKDWSPQWGGDFVWMHPHIHIPPSFNTLIMFPCNQQGWHAVSPVTKDAGSKRLSVSGWWTTHNLPAGTAAEQRQPHCAPASHAAGNQQNYVFAVNGTTGDQLDFTDVETVLQRRLHTETHSYRQTEWSSKSTM